MANAYKNKVVYNGNTLIDLSDTTAVAADVNSGKYVYLADGSRVQGSQTVHTVSETLTHVTSTNQATKVISGDSFHAVLTPDSGYRIESITVTMGGVDITDQVFTPGTGAKAITVNGTYDASDDLLGGYSQVVVNVPSGGGGSLIDISDTTAVASDVAQGKYFYLASGEKAVGTASPKNIQTVQSTSRRSNTEIGSITSLTCSTAGTYDVYWSCARSNTSQTWGSQLYINGTAYDTENTTWTNHVQNNHLTGVVLSANATVAVYGRSRSGYYIYAPQLTIVQTA